MTKTLSVWADLWWQISLLWEHKVTYNLTNRHAWYWLSYSSNDNGSVVHKLVQLRFSKGHRARCFLGDLRLSGPYTASFQAWCILRDYVMGFFPAFPRIRKQAEFREGASFGSLIQTLQKNREYFTFVYNWKKHIMSPPKTKFNLESVKEFIGNVKRKVASNPRLSLAISVLLFTVIVAVSLILALKPGQKSSETKGRCG